jgi:general secretion pathway protein G
MSDRAHTSILEHLRHVGGRAGSRLRHVGRVLFYKDRSKGRDRDGGFTLVELLVVLVILSLIMGLVGPRVLNYLSDARVRSAKLQIDSLAAALDLFYLDAGRYPSQSEGLSVLIKRPPSVDGWNGPYLQQSTLPLDPWGKPYEYRVPGRNAPYQIVSFGSDGREGGTDDAGDIVSR